LKAARRAYQFENFGFALVGIAIGDGTREVAPWSSAAICNQKGVDIGVDIGGPMPMRQCRNPGRRIKSASEWLFDDHLAFHSHKCLTSYKCVVQADNKVLKWYERESNKKGDLQIAVTCYLKISIQYRGAFLITVLLRPIIQSYVMKGRELNKFGTCHMSFGPMNILKRHRK